MKDWIDKRIKSRPTTNFLEKNKQVSKRRLNHSTLERNSSEEKMTKKLVNKKEMKRDRSINIQVITEEQKMKAEEEKQEQEK